MLALTARRRGARSAPHEQLQPGLEPIGATEAGAPDVDSESTTLPLRPFSLLVWSARHDNDWLTIVCEQPDGSFAVMAVPVTARDVSPDGITSTAGVGKLTAEEALRRKSGHAHCSPACERWQQRRELVMLLAEDAAEFEPDEPSARKRLR